MKISKYPSSRLFCLDLLRGLDMFLLVALEPLIGTANGIWHFESDAVHRQFLHVWGEFHLWDIIMPLFIFMCGAAVPFALGKRMKDGRPLPGYWRHVLGRVALLWFCGLLVQGSLASLDWRIISPYCNTLQAIAAGYLIAAGTLLIRNRIVRRAMPIVLALVYTVLLAAFGDYSKDGNFAIKVEFAVLNFILPAGSRVIELRDPWYTWFLTSLMFGAMTLCGMQATEILTGKGEPKGKAARLFGLGAALLAVGWALVPWIPSIKHIYTLTFTAQAMGWSVLALAVLYVVTDIWRVRAGLGLFILYGQFALTAYMLRDFFSPVLLALSKRCLGGFVNVFGPTPQPLVIEIGVVLALTGVLLLRRKLKTQNKAVRP